MERNLDTLREEFGARLDAEDAGGALASLLELISLDGLTEDRLRWKHQLMSDLGRHAEALEAALEFERVAERKSPFHYVRIAETCLALGQAEESIAWLERAADERGFRHARLFQHEPFDALETHPRYARLRARIEANTGLGAALPDFTIELLNGTSLRLSTLRGSAVLVDFWATICPPCVDEMPNLKRLYERYGQGEFAIVGISLDSDVEAARAFLAKSEIRWPNACSGDRWADNAAKLLNVHATPSMWLLDRQGIVRAFDLRGGDLTEAVARLVSES